MGGGGGDGGKGRNLKPHPQNRILISLRVFFCKISSKHPNPFYKGVLPPSGDSSFSKGSDECKPSSIAG